MTEPADVAGFPFLLDDGFLAIFAVVRNEQADKLLDFLATALTLLRPLPINFESTAVLAFQAIALIVPVPIRITR